LHDEQDVALGVSQPEPVDVFSGGGASAIVVDSSPIPTSTQRYPLPKGTSTRFVKPSLST